MNSGHGLTHSVLLTPQSPTMSLLEENQDLHVDFEYRANSAIWSVLENSNTQDMLEPPVFGERHVKALVSLSGSLLSMLIQFGNEFLCEQTTLDLTKFVLDVMDACVEREQATDLAKFLFKHIQETTTNTSVDQEAALITPEEDVEDRVEFKEEEQGAVTRLLPLVKEKAPRRVNPPPLNYDPMPIAELGAQFVSDLFGTDACPETVVNYTPTLSEYICDVISTARVERSTAIYAFALLNRLSVYRRVSITHGTFGLFITAYTIAGKMLGDNPYNNKSWCIAGQKMFTVEELNRLERKMCRDLRWGLDVGVEELKEVEERMLECYDDGISHDWSPVPAPHPEAPTTVLEQGPALPPTSSSPATVPNLQIHCNDFTPAAPRASTSSDPCVYLEVDSSPKWAPPSPSAFPSTRSHKEISVSSNKGLTRVGSDPTTYGSQVDDADNEDEEISDSDVF
ncbi:cyclin, amino-terminal domain protein [Rhizoctonia solani 123E]|uniref:Cyclin, amino-terminal domain protein n=1 Tax=Rhizoctonia solani 123E TaxID=1423351 RepID=A0A074SRR4_9AGAM|nr:cyclin, amino-terminal domain protein [Rhizoctonia solani 123E]